MSGAAAPGEDRWSQTLRRASLIVTSTVAAGTAVAAAYALWEGSRQPPPPPEKEEEPEEVVEKEQKQAPPKVALKGIVEEPAAPVAPKISWPEVVRHNKRDDAWIVIGNDVYNVTPFLDRHPGGKLLLLAFAGRDATDMFAEVGHSDKAREHLSKMRLGELDEGPVIDRAQSRERGHLTPRLTGGRRGSFDSEALWAVQEHGFLPARDPVGLEALERTPFRAFMELADVLPTAGLTGELRRRMQGDAELQARLLACGDPSILQDMSEDQMERAFAVVSFVMAAFWHGGTLPYVEGLPTGVVFTAAAKQLPEGHPPVRESAGSLCPVAGGSCNVNADEAMHMPEYISKPLLLLSEKLCRPPMIDYAATVLYNWTRIDVEGPISMSNIRCVLRLTGLIDEEWFFKTHIIIESEAAEAVSAVIAANRTTNDSDLLSSLVRLEEALWRVVRACLPIMYERTNDGTPQCSEHIFYQILRPLIRSGHVLFEGDKEGKPRFLCGPSGAMSALLPCVDAALGVEMSSQKLKEALGNFELSMPVEHQKFLNSVRSQPENIRDRILAALPEEEQHREQHDALVHAFNRCIARLLDFRWQHWQFVRNFIMKPGNLSNAVGTGGTTFDYLQQHITDTEKARLEERHEALAGAEPIMGRAETLVVTRQPSMRGGGGAGFWSVDGDRGLLARDPMDHPDDADWASGLKPPVLEAMRVVWRLAERMPALCAADGPFFERCAASEAQLAPLQDERAILGLPEAAREQLLTTLAHISAGCVGNGHKRPPRCIQKPLQLAASSLGRQPKLGFTEMVLSNWATTTRWEQSGEDEQGQEHLHIFWRFLGNPDEDWYRAVHIFLHERASQAVAAIRKGQGAMRSQNDVGVAGSLGQLSAWLNGICDFLDAQFEQKDSRSEPVMIRRLEPYVSHSAGNDLSWEETACMSYVMGSSALLPALHGFLGVKLCGFGDGGAAGVSAEGCRLAKLVARQSEEARLQMPRPHREFIEELERPRKSAWHYCLRRFGSQLLAVEMLHELEVGYNDALNALVRFLYRRNVMVSRLFPQLASSFGALHSDVDSVMRQKRLQLLQMRQRVNKCLER